MRSDAITSTPSSQVKTTKPVPPPQSRLSIWLSKLPKHVIPVNQVLAKQIIREINDEDSTAETLATLIQQEPILCLKLYLKANRQLKEREGHIQGLVHLIGLLGTEQIKRVIRDAPKQKAVAPGQQELYSASIFAAELAAKLLPEQHGTRGERFFLPALLFNAPLWLMWSAAPKLMQHGQLQASKRKQALKPLCEKTLGFSLESLLGQTQVFLPLPELSLKALAVDFHQHISWWAKVRRLSPDDTKKWANKDKTVKHVLYSPETGIFLINHYVLALYLDWHGKHIKRWGKLLSNHLGLSEETFDELVIEVASQLHMIKDNASSVYLSGRFSPLYRYRQLHKALPADKPTGNDHILEHYLQQLNHSQQSNRCLQLAMEALSEGVQAEHCIMLKISNKQLRIPLSYGFDQKNTNHQKELQAVHFDMDDCGAMFKTLLKKPTSISVDRFQIARLKSQLPATLTRLWKPRPCGLMSLFHNGRPYAIVICDHKDWDKEKHQHFKHIGKQLTQALKQCAI
ncbi:MAG: HDOD domain-containing protein [Cellvibrionaceae bacterium]